MLDGAAPWYDTYECADGKWLAVGPIEPQFFSLLLEMLAIDPADHPERMVPAGWPKLRTALTGRFASRARDDWAALFEGTDACVAPVLDLAEAPLHPHNVARGTFLQRGLGAEPAPAPRFSRTAVVAGEPPPSHGADTAAVLTEFGLSATEIEALHADGAA
jgi:alpha-methylacyl-CoA racemase